MLEILKSELGIGLLIFLGSLIIIFIIRKTATKKDDKILDEYVVKGIEFALSVMPQNTTVNWLKLSKNALSQFIEVYTKSNGAIPNKELIGQAMNKIQDIAKKKAGLI